MMEESTNSSNYPTTASDVNDPPPVHPDMQIKEEKLNIWQLCQRDRYDELSKAIEGGADVTEKDAENISCLHWASINNRVNICELLISKGAEVDAVGGELLATPLLWAVRYGHLETTIMLLRHGADPSIADNQGFNALHLSCQFNFVKCTSYLLARGMNVDIPDSEGKTPLMWSCIKSFDKDLHRLLLAMNASINVTDSEGKTALHYAIMHNNMGAAMSLRIAKANYNIKDNEGKSAHDLCFNPDPAAPTVPRGFASLMPPPNAESQWVSVLHREPTRKFLLCLIPFLTLVGMGLAMEMVIIDPIKAAAFLVGLAVFIGKFYALVAENPEVNYSWPGPMAVFLATMFMVYGAFFWQLWSYTQGPDALVGYWWDAAAVISTVGTWYYWFKANLTPPGFIHVSNQQSVKDIIHLSETGKLDSEHFCYSCAAKKAYRSKHCSLCGTCVAKFDHHCPFVDNCVAQNNHRFFMLFLLFLPILISSYNLLAYRYLMQECKVYPSYIRTVFGWLGCQPFVCWTIANGVMHTMWVAGLFIMQNQQIINDLTTNEAINRWRYSYLSGGSPWTLGGMKNLVVFFNPYNNKDWSKVYTLPGEVSLR